MYNEKREWEKYFNEEIIGGSTSTITDGETGKPKKLISHEDFIKAVYKIVGRHEKLWNVLDLEEKELILKELVEQERDAYRFRELLGDDEYIWVFVKRNGKWEAKNIHEGLDN